MGEVSYFCVFTINRLGGATVICIHYCAHTGPLIYTSVYETNYRSNLKIKHHNLQVTTMNSIEHHNKTQQNLHVLADNFGRLRPVPERLFEATFTVVEAAQIRIRIHMHVTVVSPRRTNRLLEERHGL